MFRVVIPTQSSVKISNIHVLENLKLNFYFSPALFISPCLVEKKKKVGSFLNWDSPERWVTKTWFEITGEMHPFQIRAKIPKCEEGIVRMRRKGCWSGCWNQREGTLCLEALPTASNTEKWIRLGDTNFKRMEELKEISKTKDLDVLEVNDHVNTHSLREGGPPWKWCYQKGIRFSLTINEEKSRRRRRLRRRTDHEWRSTTVSFCILIQ